MRGHCHRHRMEDFSQLNRGNVVSQEKMELVKMFAEFLDSGKCGEKFKMDKRGYHGKFGHFGKHGHGKHHKGHGPFGHHGHHGHRGHHGHHGHHHHGKFGHRHHHNLHHNNGKFKAHWVIDLTRNEEDARCVGDNERNTSLENHPNTSALNEQEQAAIANKTICKCMRRRRCGRDILLAYSIGNNATTSTDNTPPADKPISETNVEQAEENITTMIENIDIDNSE